MPICRSSFMFCKRGLRMILTYWNFTWVSDRLVLIKFISAQNIKALEQKIYNTNHTKVCGQTFLVERWEIFIILEQDSGDLEGKSFRTLSIKYHKLQEVIAWFHIRVFRKWRQIRQEILIINLVYQNALKAYHSAKHLFNYTFKLRRFGRIWFAVISYPVSKFHDGGNWKRSVPVIVEQALSLEGHCALHLRVSSDRIGWPGRNQRWLSLRRVCPRSLVHSDIDLSNH